LGSLLLYFRRCQQKLRIIAIIVGMIVDLLLGMLLLLLGIMLLLDMFNRDMPGHSTIGFLM
jgi:hypothetical protein